MMTAKKFQAARAENGEIVERDFNFYCSFEKVRARVEELTARGGDWGFEVTNDNQRIWAVMYYFDGQTWTHTNLTYAAAKRLVDNCPPDFVATMVLVAGVAER